jgi:hypothetical protein
MPARYKITLSDEFIAAANHHYLRQHAWRRHVLGIKGAAVFALLVTGAVLAAAAGSWLLVPLAALVGTLFPGFAIDRWIQRRRFRKSPYYNDEIFLTLSDDGVHGTGRTSELRLAWSAFTRARRFSDGLLLLQGPQLMNWLPNGAATESTSVEEAVRLVRQHIRDFRDA